MAEDWAAIQAEVMDAIASVGFSATVTRPASGGGNPWDTPSGTATTYTVTVLDDGIKDRYAPGGLILRKARVLTIGALGYTPAISDTITVRGVAHEIQAVLPIAPGGVDLMFEVEIGA